MFRGRGWWGVCAGVGVVCVWRGRGWGVFRGGGWWGVCAGVGVVCVCAGVGWCACVQGYGGV